MARSLGRHGRVEVLDILDKLRFEDDAEVADLPIASTGKITLKDANTSAKRIEVTQDGSSEGRFVVMNDGDVYSKGKLNPSFVDNNNPNNCTVGNPGQLWRGVYSTVYHFSDGSQQTSAALPSAQTVVYENSQTPVASWTENPILTDATKHYKIILRNVRIAATGTLEMNFYSGTGNIINGDTCWTDYRTGAFGNTPIIPGSQSIFLHEAAETFGGGQIALIEIDFYQRTGSRANICINTTYGNGTGRPCRRSQVYGTNGTQATGINLRSSGGDVGGDIQVIQYA